MPRRIAQFERIAVPFGQRAQERFEPVEVDFPEGRKLKDNGAELGLKLIETLEVASDRFLGGSFQFFMWVMKRLPFAAKQKRAGVDERQFASPV